METIENVKVEKIAEMYNENGMSLQVIAEHLGSSKSTIQRVLAKGGYSLNKTTKKYETNINNKGSETINMENNTIDNNKEEILSENNVSSKSNIKSETMINRTYAISDKMDRAIKIKSAIEGKKPIDIVREALEKYVDDKYFNM